MSPFVTKRAGVEFCFPPPLQPVVANAPSARRASLSGSLGGCRLSHKSVGASASRVLSGRPSGATGASRALVGRFARGTFLTLGFRGMHRHGSAMRQPLARSRAIGSDIVGPRRRHA
ncbi:hypothetical protein AGABI1DRAFT_135239 [Agaricus bisporus var. burnettii JB137-S8]|uniref:Uncharacterized protein n=1 Tax=Agaricus bisporus var. burnettii (strain JB137-S8 / ATCC MYA-4627 / FGSC 10392) TaxID=597362 RepID=K5WRT8_AGABU|nr:uncharacterized protein AGABI1DRAFT_135239 [Agaricus bisporus var. burnettii JB137-S8]EKM73247.1 hypothetical protein AGABI1DRAFT_135239 [Agaricus bisporus var. burnettii JB137-S8]